MCVPKVHTVCGGGSHIPADVLPHVLVANDDDVRCRWCVCVVCVHHARPSEMSCTASRVLMKKMIYEPYGNLFGSVHQQSARICVRVIALPAPKRVYSTRERKKAKHFFNVKGVCASILMKKQNGVEICDSELGCGAGSPFVSSHLELGCVCQLQNY